MTYNFDEIIERRNTNSLKFDFAKERRRPEDVLPLWVADMDFQCPLEVREALNVSTEHGIFGYSEVKDDYFQALHKWYSTGFDWDIKADWLIKTPGIVFAITLAIRAFSNEGESILIQTPVYYPFFQTILANKRNLVTNPVELVEGKYQINFQDFEEKIVAEKVKLFVLCSPHNPVSRVYTKEELEQMGAICLKHGVIVVSDEIHSDFVFAPHKHTVFANISPELNDITITCTAPSKTFNLAGLQVSNIFIANQTIRDRFQEELDRSGYSQLNTMGLVATKAAYEFGHEWLNQLIPYLQDNIAYLTHFIKTRLPKLSVIEPEGTYLVWIDFRGLGLTQREADRLITDKGKLWLDSGRIFGPEGIGFQRINIACPRSRLEQALLQLEHALS